MSTGSKTEISFTLIDIGRYTDINEEMQQAVMTAADWEPLGCDKYIELHLAARTSARQLRQR